MILQASAATDVGLRRRMNEDRYALVPDLGLYLVADGMGGHRAGQMASQIAAETAVRTIFALEGAVISLSEKLRQVVACANREIFNAARENPEFEGMGTTLVAILAAEGRLALAHVGDSRAYLLRDGLIRPLTDDHSLVAELVRRRQITAEDAREHPHRHVLTCALGVRPQVQGDLLEMTPREGDVFAMFSDGLTTHLRDEEIALALSNTPDLQEACDGLISMANDRGGEDNITVVLVRCEKSGE
ncbi:MAG: Stp1/IreP family PP2C-type Ser/Thr phosphatase [Myxococcales bacterium]|nr:Stp1/IreP family PP2C-type Ser/Thr phosphatase [Myxococcales bacterium]